METLIPTIQQIIQLLLISFLIRKFEPIEWVLNGIDSMLNNIQFKSINANLIKFGFLQINYLVRKLFSCLKCISFWTTLIITKDIYLTSLVFFITYWYSQKLAYLDYQKLQ